MKKTQLLCSLFTVCILSSAILPVMAAGEKMINTSAGKSYAGYGYTHGYVPVTTGTGRGYDNDIMKYDINNSQYLFRSPFYYNNDDQYDNIDDSYQSKQVEYKKQLNNGYYR